MLQTKRVGGLPHREKNRYLARNAAWYPYLFPAFLVGVVLLVDGVLYASHPWFTTATYALLAPWLALLPLYAASHVTLPLHTLPPQPFIPVENPIEIFFFVGMCIIQFLLYFLALAQLPQRITFRFLFISTLCIGIAYVLLPVITSQDVFSYIAYARMLVIYHLDPFTTIPTSIYTDSVYPFLFWINQPSIYGPTWLILTAALQWLALGLGLHSVLAIEVLLRLFGLVMHLGATWLLWLLSGHMRDLNVDGWVPETPVQRQKRLRAVLAFAWNPFLLLEACVNAHNDTTILFIVLGALWFLAQSQSRQTRRSPWAYLLAALVLAVAACVKITLLIFLPALLLYLWMRWATRARYQRAVVEVVAASGIYLCTMVLLYAPFWHQESLRYVFQVAPTASRDVNSLYETVASIYAHFSGGSLSDNLAPGTSAEVFSHSLSTILFACVFGIYCLRSIRSPVLINTFPALVSWMAWAWLLYCIIGSPWFWPWYTTTFFGLAALVEAAHAYKKRSVPWLSLFVCLLAVSMMSMYSFGNWVPETSSSFLSQWRWMSLRGIWIWIFPFVSIICVRWLIPLWERAGPNALRKKRQIPS